MEFRSIFSLLLLPMLLGFCKAQLENDYSTENEISLNMSDMEDISSTIQRMNNGSTDFLLEGDILIPRKRNAMKCYNKEYSCLWAKSPNGNVEIPFQISTKYDYTERITILKAMRDFEYKTCIRFIPRASQRAYLSIEPRFGCSSLLGRIGDRQMVSLQRYGCVRHGIIQHELLHALGFNHEHNRSDRDQYVKINWDNFDQYYAINFRKMDSNNLFTPYDYTSILHYAKNAFGRYGTDTITPIPDPSVSIGQRDQMSRLDVLRVNRLYKCWDYL